MSKKAEVPEERVSNEVRVSVWEELNKGIQYVEFANIGEILQ